MVKFGFSGERTLCRWIDAARIVLALMSVLLLAMILLRILQMEGARQALVVDEAAHARQAYEVTVDCYVKQADLALNLEVRRPDVLELVAAAWAAEDEARRSPLRRQLQERMTPVYASLVQSGFRQFHFHFPDCSSFLRLHLPQKYGDSLAELRPTVAAANRTQRKIEAFEEGLLYNGYRNVYPLACEGKPVGSVEISFSSRALLEGMNRKIGGQHELLIRRAVVESTVWPDARSNYRGWRWNEDYFQDAETAATPLLGARGAVRDTADLRQRIAAGLEQRKDFSVRTRIDGRTEAWHFLALEDHSGQQIGYWLVRHTCAAVDMLDRHMLFAMMIFGGILIACAAGFVWLGQVRRRIVEMGAFLPICATCKKVRERGTDSKSPDSWMSLEEYFARHTDSQVTHGICPTCFQKALEEE